MFPRLQNRVFYIDFCVRSHGKNCLSLKLWKKTVYTELGTRQLYSFATTTLRLRNLQCLKDQKNIQVSMSRWSSCNNQQLCGLKTWSRCGDSTYYRVASSVYVTVVRTYFSLTGIHSPLDLIVFTMNHHILQLQPGVLPVAQDANDNGKPTYSTVTYIQHTG